MPSKECHIEKCEHNDKAFKFLDSNTDEFPDWEVTMTFYSILHDVDALLDMMPFPHHLKHPKSHKIRNKFLARHLPQIAEAYGNLYQVSRWARYTSLAFDQNFVNAARDWFSEIHSFLDSRRH